MAGHTLRHGGDIAIDQEQAFTPEQGTQVAQLGVRDSIVLPAHLWYILAHPPVDVDLGELRPKLKPRWDVHLSGDDDQLG